MRVRTFKTVHLSAVVLGRGVLFAALALTACGEAGDEPEGGDGARLDVSESSHQGLTGGEQASPGEWDSAVFWFNQVGACSSSVVSDRHVLTAAHCVTDGDYDRGVGYGTVMPGMEPGAPLAITQGKVLTETTPYHSNTIARVVIHPSWELDCRTGCAYGNSTQPPYPADLALIELTEPIPQSFPRARVLSGALLPGVPVQVMGFGCEAGLYTPSDGPSRLKTFATRSLSADHVAHPLSFVNRERSTIYERHYVLTPGQDFYNEASICPGDSGGPLYLSDISEGEIVVGINAYYTFRSPSSGISTINTHTRLGRDNPLGIAAWLAEYLPATSIAEQAPSQLKMEEFGIPEVFDVVREGTENSDLLRGQDKDDWLSGGAGEDWMFGGAGDDLIEGGERDDELHGEAGHDALFGGAGADLLDGGAGEDLLLGGEGPDLYLFTPGGGHDLVLNDTQGQNRVMCQGFEPAPTVYRQGLDWIVLSATGEESMRVTNSRIVSFYGCTHLPPLVLDL